MPVDVRTEVEINRSRSEVAAYAADPDKATAWYENIESVDWKTARPLAVGSQVAFVATFLGRRLAYTYVIKDFAPGVRLVMSTADGPFAMETTYNWEDTPRGSTRMILRDRGEQTGFSKIAAPIMAKAMRRANRKDPQRIKKILESHPTG
jgi:catechol 2,3-dioxygenase-like lactoylglutathione lyase family enzyme